MNLAILKKYHNLFGKLAEEKKSMRLFLIIDFLWSFIKHGIYPHQYLNTDFSELKGFERRKILTYGRWKKLIKTMGSPEYIHLLRNKLEFNIKFAQFINRKWLYTKNSSAEDIKTFLYEHKNIIIKPLTAWEGEGVQKITVKDITNIDRFVNNIISQELLIEECITNHPDLVISNSLNTIRVTTIIDNQKNVQLIKPFLRAGVGASVVDNYNAGGVEYEIDIETGIIISKGFCKGEAIHIFHPSSNIQMLGKHIPHWNDVVKLVKNAHSQIPQCRYIGWDVAITNNGIELIEGNHDAGYFGLEYFGTRRWWQFIKDIM